jgi:hypothetical protein
MDNKIKLALQDLHEAVINKIQEVKFLEKKITNFSIENAKLHNEIDKLNNLVKNHLLEKKDLSDKLANNLVINDPPQKKDILINEDTTQDIDISISQLKNIFNKNK